MLRNNLIISYKHDHYPIKERANILIETKALLLHQDVVDEVETIFDGISSLKEIFTNDDKKLGQITDLKNDLCLKFKEYEILFDKYLNTEKHNADQCTEVTIKDAFIRNPFQFQNLKLFVTYLLDTFKNLRCITVATRNINTLEELRHRKKRFFKKNENEIKQKLSAKQAIFETKLSELAQNCNQKSVAFELEINRNIYDRHILFNHGIIVSMGRGLDVFKKTQNPNDIRSKIPCYETQITFFNAFESEKSF
uniref:MIT_C domain-containing protein n=1 Tax=Rhabditophanes sp. KR3021 TaxID=114890 RepID=A0AC35TQE3_9BILA